MVQYVGKLTVLLLEIL